ncbi:MAG: YjgN family protein [Acidiferrobacterales bacterium]
MDAALNTMASAARPSVQPQELTPIPFEFNGKAWEYFKIWIVNILLTIVTLGIYSAWAKVRRKRYFYGNTLLRNAPFEYLAEPMQILKGRLIAFGIFVVWAIAANIFPLLEGLFGLLFVVLVPWLVIRAHAFNSRYSAYRNIRFGFKAGYGRALGIYIGLPILAVLTLGLAYPVYSYQRSKFIVANSGYGTAPFTFKATVGNFYVTYIKAALIVILGMLLIVAIGWFFAALPQVASGVGLEANTALGMTSVFMAIAILGLLLTVRAYVDTQITNLVWSNVATGKNRLRSTLATPQMLWLYLSNALAVIFSLGLLIPWAQIRMTRYRLDNLRLLAASELDSFVAKEQEAVASAGEEISDFFDIDIGL